MRLILLTVLTMLAFASNSILTRMAIDGGHVDTASFAALRLLSGAIVLGAIVHMRHARLPLLAMERIPGALSLAAYTLGFTLAYLSLDAGLGALVLFGVVQITIFAYGLLSGTSPTRRQTGGAGIAFAGLMLVLLPSEGSNTSLGGLLWMVLAGVGWGIYTLIGRKARNPLAATGANFVLATPLIFLMLPGQSLHISLTGLFLGIICGAVTSGLGYSLWYSVLPRMQAATAAIVQLSVPVIAMLAGVLFLGETLGPLLVISAILVVGGIALAVTPGKSKIMADPPQAK